MARSARMVIATVLLGSVLALAPLPGVAWAAEMDTHTRHPRMRAVDGPGAVARGAVVPSASRGELGAHLPEEAGHGHRNAGGAGSPLGATETGLDPFVAFGITLDRVPSEPVAFRALVDGRWTEWRELSFTVGHAPDGPEGERAGARVPSDPFWLGSATGYEVQVPDGAGELAVHLVTEERRRVLVEPEHPDAGASDIAIHSRAEWGARPPARPSATAPSLELAIVHHSDTANAYSAAQVPSILRSIQAFHIDVNGWDDIAYNFAVDRFGRVWEARAGGVRRAIVGGHAYGFNTGTTGVVVLGDYTSASPTSASVTAVGELISWKFAQHQTPPTGTYTYRSGADTHFGPAGTPVTLPRVTGHRNVRQTSCPGSLSNHLGTIRNHVQARYPTYQAGAPSRPLAGDQRGDGGDDLLLYRPGGSADPIWTGRPGPSFAASATNVGSLYEPITGDFDGNRADDVLWYAAGAAQDYLWLRRPVGTHADIPISINGQYDPYVGDFDGNGADDVLWHGPYDGADSVWWFDGSGGRRPTSLSIPGPVEPLVGDFDGDGRDDVALYGPGSAPDRVLFGRAGGFDAVPIAVNGVYRPLVGDFDGDGNDDIFWFGPGGRADHLWRGRADRTFSSTPRAVGGDYQPFVGDFDGNGMDDIFWFGPGGDRDYQWWHVVGGWVDTSQQYGGDHPYAVLDVDGDRTDEIVWLEGPTSGTMWSAALLQPSFRTLPVP